MVVAFYFRLHLAYFFRPAVAISARPEHREKMLRQKLSKEERRTRSHRLIVQGVVFESIVPEAKDMTDEEAAALLNWTPQMLDSLFVAAMC